MNAIIKTIRIAGVSKSDGAPFSISSFLNFLKSYSDAKYSDFKSRLYKWSCDIYAGADKQEDIKQYLTDLLKEVFACTANTIEKVQPFFQH